MISINLCTIKVFFIPKPPPVIHEFSPNVWPTYYLRTNLTGKNRITRGEQFFTRNRRWNIFTFIRLERSCEKYRLIFEYYEISSCFVDRSFSTYVRGYGHGSATFDFYDCKSMIWIINPYGNTNRSRESTLVDYRNPKNISRAICVQGADTWWGTGVENIHSRSPPDVSKPRS